MTSAIEQAARETLADEERRIKRGHRARLSEDQLATLKKQLSVLNGGEETPVEFARRGSLHLDVSGYVDASDEVAASIVSDLMWAVSLLGYDPASVLQKGWDYFQEDGRVARNEPEANDD